MVSLRGQAIGYVLTAAIAGFFVLFLILGFIPSLSQQAQIATSNTTLTPTNGLTYITVNFAPALYIFGGIILIYGLFQYNQMRG